MDDTRAVRVLAGYDGSLPAGAAIDAGAMLLPSGRAWIITCWTAPFADEALRRHLRDRQTGLHELDAAIEREGAADAEHVAAMGVTLARAAGWACEPVIEQTYGGVGYAIADLAEKLDADVVVVGSRGLGGAPAVLGSVSDVVAHSTPRPVLVVPHPLLTDERADLTGGPVLVGWDGSPGAQLALDAAQKLFAGRPTILAAVTDDAVAPPTAAHEFLRLHAHGGHLTPGRAVAEALASAARRRHAAVVVVGSRGHSAPREILLGSAAMATLHHAHRPVLVVHDAHDR
ncbi:universal stress protein [Actinoplanes sp. KI2]|uniref:universal stress protein n=1 Tax=Actinoplanes sp. KI2 TaxID=2983315 RepID=UPI0021D5F340|nr:universal stress protein [Actinoplanes sp. KI2]MCU7729408.1 universal stress protein [Actinoplanes sp. KI2]